MKQLLNFLLSLVLIYGYPIIFAIVLGGSIGIPMPATSILLAAGSFTVDGSLNIFILIPLVTLTAICGDIIGYYIGKKLGVKRTELFTTRIGISNRKMAQLTKFLDRWGISFIFLTRWLLTPLGTSVNIIAGIHEYPFRRFLYASITGELLWSIIYIYLGYLFGVNWLSLVDYFSNAPYILVFIFIGVVSFRLAIRRRIS